MQKTGKNPVATKPAVVTTGSDADKYDLTFMNHFNATLALNVDSLIYRGMEIGQLTVKAENGAASRKSPK